MKIIGLMSGTSMDGIDVCFAETDGGKNFYIIDTLVTEYNKNTKFLIKKLNQNTEKLIKNKTFIKELAEKITYDHFKAANKIIHKNKDKPVVIGFHGQTILHLPSKFKSIQIGNAKLLSKLLRKDVVYDFRKRDLSLHGQGAPISPIYHKFLIEEKKLNFPSCFINIGGITNISFCDKKKLIGFDTGPGNCLIDKFVQEKLGIDFDENGKFAYSGNINFSKLKILLDDDYFKQDYPKSLDKNYFNKYLNLFKDAKIEDTIATLSLFTVKTIALEISKFKKKPQTCVISGGGAKNNFIMENLINYSDSKIFSATNLGINPDTIEAEMICYLTARRIKQLPITFPTTTGVIKPSIGGEVINYKEI